MVITMKINVKGFKIDAAIRIHMDSASEISSRSNIDTNLTDKSESNSDVKLDGFDLEVPVALQMDEASLEIDPKEVNEIFHHLNKSITDTIRNEMKASVADIKKEN